jgi:uncharacterized membrane protein YgdD (TMEM256/DUF423 family)
MSSTVANAIMNGLCRNTAWSQPAAVYIKLHTGDPGASAASNAAGNTTRQQATFGTTASGGSLSNTAAVTWTSVSNTETYTHYSAWDASSAGNFLFSGTLTANAVAIGDTFTIAIGSLTASLTPIAA